MCIMYALECCVRIIDYSLQGNICENGAYRLL